MPKLNAKLPTLTRVQLNFGLGMYLDHTFGLRLSLNEITSFFGFSGYLDRTFVQRIGSAKVKSNSEVTHCLTIKLSTRGAEFAGPENDGP